MSPEFHQNFTRNHWKFTRISLEVHHNFDRISNWSTLKRGISTTQPSHTSYHVISCLLVWIPPARVGRGGMHALYHVLPTWGTCYAGSDVFTGSTRSGSCFTRAEVFPNTGNAPVVSTRRMIVCELLVFSGPEISKLKRVS